MSKKKEEIKVIIFDLSEVYLKGFHRFEKKFKYIANTKSREFNSDFLSKTKEFDLLMKGKISENEFINYILSKNKLKIDLDKFKKVLRSNFEEIKGTREIIEKLKKRGYKLGLLSNHSKEWIKHCSKKFDFHKLFDSVLYSFEIGVCKPNEEIFIKILEKLNELPENCLFIDDSKTNLTSAKSLGMKTILFKNPYNLIKDLKKYDIKI
ncbi:MAG: HAD family phosphatase [Candidatus Nanoarchaeia archaeon]|nr:HAD family phosphatase [Candidatus Nanoarchaeia archaeon]